MDTSRLLPPPPSPPRLGDRALFPDLGTRVYWNHAAISPPSVHVKSAVNAVLADYSQLGSQAFLPWIGQRDRTRALLARLLGGAPDDWALTPGTSRGLLDVATCLQWRPGDRILLFEGEFPANVTPWQQAARAHDLGLDWCTLAGFGDGSGDGLARVEALLAAGRTRLVAVSAVQFQTGLRMPLTHLGALCHAHGALLCVDGIQAAGAVPVDVASSQVDFFAAGTHKWAMGLDGSGFLYVSPRALPQLTPTIASWLSHEEGLRFLFEGEGHLRYDRPVRRKADFLEVGAWNTMGFAALEAGLSLIEEIGVEAIHAHINQLHDALEEALVERGFESLRPRDPAARSGTLSARPPSGVDVTRIEGPMAERGVTISAPDGKLRFSPHWPNSADQLPTVVGALDDTLSQLGRAD